MTEYRDKLLSLSFRARKPAPKVTHFDARDTGAEDAVVTEHWDGRQDVHITTPTVAVGAETRSPL